MRQPRFDIVTLQDDHVAALAAPTIEITARSSPIPGRRHHFQKTVADRHQGIHKAVFLDLRIDVTNHRAKYRADRGD
jgi:hypothetical protein